VRVIQATDYGSPFPGSFLPMLRASVRACHERGWDATVILPPRARQRDWLPELERDGIDPVFAPAGSRRALAHWLGELAAADSGPVLIHSHFTVFDLPSAWVGRRRPRTSVVWHAHTVLSQALRYRLQNRVKLSLLSGPVSRILCVAPHLVDALARRGAPREKLVFFPNAVDVDRYPLVTPERRAAARRELELPGDATVLLHIGRDLELKGGDYFLETLKLLTSERGDVVGVSLRGGDETLELAERMGLAEAIRVLPGTPHVDRLYAAADLLLAPSRAEGMPLAVLEALASGLPIVASDIPGHAVLPAAELRGLRVATLDPTLLAEEVRTLLGRPPEAALADADAGRAWVRAQMGVDAWSEKLTAMYERAFEDIS
jgi:glycosyltransferase involved in cell wall biosynthesis